MIDQDPNETAQISGSDFAQMCDEMKQLRAERDALRADVARLRDVLQRIVSNGGSATNVMVFDARTALAQ